MSPEDLPDGLHEGIYAGIYKVTVTHPDLSIPADVNAEVLGLEVPPQVNLYDPPVLELKGG